VGSCLLHVRASSGALTTPNRCEMALIRPSGALARP
jgi:hypothetical protein